MEQKPNSEKGFGFSISGGSSRSVPIVVDSVTSGSPANKAGLRVGDELLLINGESVVHKYHVTVNRMIHEALRLGDIELLLRRPRSPTSAAGAASVLPASWKSTMPSIIAFDEKRQAFSHQDSSEQVRREKPAFVSRWTAPAMRNPAAGPMVSSAEQTLRTFGQPAVTQQKLVSESEPAPAPQFDYMVSIVDQKRTPGKLKDFIPECERAHAESQSDVEQSDGSVVETPQLLRNYDMEVHKANDIVRSPTSPASIVSEERNSTPSPRQRGANNEDATTQRATLFQQQLAEAHREQLGQTPLDTKLRQQLIEQQRRASPSDATPSMTRPFSRVKRNVAFWSEPDNWNSHQRNGSAAVIDELVQVSQKIDKPPQTADEQPKSEVEEEEDRVFDESTAAANVADQMAYMSLAAGQRARTNQPTYKTDVLLSEAAADRPLSDQLQSAEQCRRPAEDWRGRQRRTRDDGPLVSVSGRHRCSHCADELGRGAAMIVESLGLFYHLRCFRCSVCSVSLGSGQEGADVRVRAGKLHCQTCYSNDRAGLKYSQV